MIEPQKKINKPTDRKKIKSSRLDQLSLLRDIYRALLNSGRSYAAFEDKKVLPLAKELVDRKGVKEMFDPMSGYGRLMSYCSRLGIKSFGIEFNPPQYLWQLLNHPGHTSKFITATEDILSQRKRWPKSSLRAFVSEDWYPPESKRLILSLLDLSKHSLTERTIAKKEELSLALLLPFVGRFSCSIPADTSAHVKKRWNVRIP